MTISSSRVALVGAGTGNPGLLTLRAAECLAEADLVIYDRLVPERLLEFAAPEIPRVRVTQEQDIIPLLIERAREGKRVVRLKGGDPFLFGRGGEEALALHEAGIPFEVVPGVTAALAAAAYTGIPLTHPGHASAVALITGHGGAAGLDWAALARFPGTLVLYMAIAPLAEIVAELLRHGMNASTPCAVVRHASLGTQQTIEAPLLKLPEAVREAGITPPAMVLIGDVVGLRAQLSWFDKLPLLGKRGLVTRPRHQAAELVQQLEALGAACSLLPLVEVREPPEWGPVDRALASLATYDWLVFTSVNGVHAFVRRLRATGRDLRALGSLRLAVIGPSTADALREYHLEPDLIPAEYRSEALAAALMPVAAGRRILLARADRGRDLLRDELGKVATVEQVAVYSQVDAVDPTAEGLQALRRGEIDFVTLTSSNIARALAAALDEATRAMIHAGKVRLVSISPVTSAAIRELGLPVAAEATEYTMAGVVEALVRLVTSS